MALGITWVIFCLDKIIVVSTSCTLQAPRGSACRLSFYILHFLGLIDTVASVLELLTDKLRGFKGLLLWCGEQSCKKW